MVSKEKILELTLKNHSNGNHGLVSKIQKEYNELNFKDVTKVLKEYYIDSMLSRMTTIWNIEHIIEEVILDNVHKSDEILILDESYKIAKTRFYKLLQSEDMFKVIVKQRGYKNINDMRAFAAVCEGDMEVYKAYSGNSDEILSYALVRVLSIANTYTEEEREAKYREILELSTNVIKSIYNVEDTKNLSVEETIRANFKEKDYLLDEYKKLATKKEVVFAEGILKLLKKYFEKINKIEEYQLIEDNFYNAFKGKVSEEDSKENNKNEEIEEASTIENEKTIEELVKELSIEGHDWIDINDIGVDTKEEPVGRMPFMLDKDELVKNPNTLDVEKVEEESVSIDALVKDIKMKFTKLEAMVQGLESDTKKESNKANEVELEELRKENSRLKNEVDTLRRRISEVSLKDFIQRIGGRECGYQLSELHMLSEGTMEDDGNIQGRLINLFGILEGYFLEAYIGNKNINDEFEIDRKTLSQKYLLEMPLRGEDEVVKVKLIRNGWKYNSEVIVPPLVRQLF